MYIPVRARAAGYTAKLDELEKRRNEAGAKKENR